MEITVVLDDEQIETVFENAEIKLSKTKLKKLKSLVSEQDMDIKEVLEERLMEFLEEIVTEEWER
jgi:hypothetical protein